jgi:cobalamin biosynthesis protein CobD/CbiB
MKRFRTLPHYNCRNNFRMHQVLEPLSRFSRMENLLHAGQYGVAIMSLAIMIVVVGCVVTCALIGCSALNESGKLTEIRERIASWKQTSNLPADAISEAALESIDESAA